MHLRIDPQIFEKFPGLHLGVVVAKGIENVEGDLVLTFAKGDELFQQLHSGENMAPHPGEVVYRDDKEVLCRRWNWRS